MKKNKNKIYIKETVCWRVVLCNSYLSVHVEKKNYPNTIEFFFFFILYKI